MYTSLNIKNFRAFRTLEIEGLKRVNLFTGRNGSGKTSVLEAVYLLDGSNDAPRVQTLYKARGLGSTTRFSQRTMPWATLFYDSEVETDIELSGANASGDSTKMEVSTELSSEDRRALPALTYEPDGILVTRKLQLSPRPRDFLFVKGDKVDFLSRSFSVAPQFLLAGNRSDPLDLATYYNSLEMERAQQPLLKALQVIDARISDLRTNFSDGLPVMYVDVGGTRLLPLAVAGDGAGRLFEIALAMKRGEGGVVLIDEIENGFHHSALPKVWKLIHELAKEYNVQVFAVTHSQECAEAAHEAAKNADYDFQYFRMEQQHGIGRAFPFSREIFQTAIETELEIR